MHVTDVMHRPVVTVRPDDTIEQAATVLTKEQIDAAPVVDAPGGLVRMVSESDLLLHEVPPSGAVRNEHPRWRDVRTVRSSSPTS